MIMKNVSGLIASFHEERGQTTEPPKRSSENNRSRKQSTTTSYEAFLRKYRDLENCIDDLGTKDLVYYFREVAEENGYSYMIANMKKDMAIMKRLKENYTVREICGMIEFLYVSEQDYLDKDRLSPNILASQWVNTVYADMKLWVDDKYVSRSAKKSLKTHEWNKSVAGTDNDTKIGVKL